MMDARLDRLDSRLDLLAGELQAARADIDRLLTAYALGGRYSDQRMTLSEIGKELGISKQRMYQLAQEEGSPAPVGFNPCKLYTLSDWVVYREKRADEKIKTFWRGGAEG